MKPWHLQMKKTMETNSVITGKTVLHDSIEFTLNRNLLVNQEIRVQILPSENRMFPWTKISTSNNAVRIDLAALPKGIYTVIISMPGETNLIEQFVRH